MALDLTHVIPIYQEHIDNLIDQLGKNITLFFKQNATSIDPEFYDPVRGQESRMPDNKADSNTPAPTVERETKTIKALLRHTSGPYEGRDIRAMNTVGTLRLKTYLTDLPDLTRCEYIKANVDIEGLFDVRFKLAAAPVPVGLQRDRYVVTFWERMD